MDSSTTSSGAAPAVEVDQGQRVAAFLADIRKKQSINGAIAGGSIGAVVGAVLWAAITAATNFEIAWEAVGVGFLVGFGVRKLGGGIDPVFGYIGGILSGLGIALGNILTGMVVVSNTEHIPFLQIASHLNGNLLWLLLTANFSVVDVLFYALGIYYGYRYSIRTFRLSPAT